MDETKKGGQGDNTSEVPGGSTSKESEPQTFTQEQVTKAVSDALAKAGRTDKSLKEKQDRLDADKKAFDAERESWLVSESELNKDDPDSLDVIAQKKIWRKKNSELIAREKEMQERQTTIDEAEQAQAETKSEITIWQIAQAKQVDASELKEKVLKLEIKTEEAITEVAQLMKRPKAMTHVPGKIAGEGEDLEGL